MIRNLLLLGCFSFLPITQIQAQTKILSKHEEIFASIDHLAVNFTQTTYKKLRDRSVSRSGNAFFSKPNKFRWNFENEKTGLEEYYFNGEKLTHFKDKDKLVSHYNNHAGLAKELQEVVNLVLDPKALLNRYKVKELSSESGRTQAIMTPKITEGSDVDSIFVKVSDLKKFVEEVQIFYTDGNNTQFIFKNPSTTSNDPKIFTFLRSGNYTIRHHG